MNDAEKILSVLDARELGRKLRLARERRGMKQEEAAKAIGVARTTIVAIEKGERRVRPEELVQLALEYGRDVTEFLQEMEETLFTEPQFRGPEHYEDEEDAKIEQWIEALKELATDYYEYEQLLDAPMVKKYPTEYEVGRLKAAAELGESIALEERQRLGLGDKPISILRTLLEQEVGLRIYYLPIKPSKYSAIYLYSDQIGGCIAVNSQHPEDRDRMSLARDYGHFLTSRYKPTLYIEGFYPRRSENEKIADQFAVHFLMPTTGITRKFNDIRKAKGKVTPYDLVEMAHYFGVSFEALCYRLEELHLIPSGMLEHLKEQGFKVRDVQQRLGLELLPADRQRIPLRHTFLAVEALDQGLISESRFAQLLEVDRLEARAIFAALRGEALSH